MTEAAVAHVLSCGLFTQGFGSPQAWVRGVADGAVVEPGASLLTGRSRRYTSLGTRVVAEVAGQAFAAADVAPSSVRSVFGAARGECATALALMELGERPTGSSPARFTQSVHSAPSGVLSLATGNRHASVTVCAGAGTLVAAWLEVLGLLHEAPDPVLLVLCDEALPPALAGGDEHRTLGVAFLVAGRPWPASLATASGLQRVDGPAPRVDEALRAYPAAAALPLLEALVGGRAGVIPLELTAGARFCVALRPTATPVKATTRP